MKKLSTKEFIKRAIQVHGLKYNYENVNYVDASTKVSITCNKHGPFKQNPSSHVVKGTGCPTCAKEQLVKNNKSRAKDSQWFIDQAIKAHGAKYDYTLVQYKTQDLPVKIVCPVHGDFMQRPSDHIYGRCGCPSCNIQWSNSKQKQLAKFIESASQIHGTVYDYSLVKYKTNTTPITIICKQHGTFLQKPIHHTRGSGCPVCSGSRGETIIANWFNEHNINYVFQRSFDGCVSEKGNPLYFDFYLPDHKMLIEFDGEQHRIFVPHFHQTQKQFEDMFKRDEIKTQYAQNNNYRLIRIIELTSIIRVLSSLF